MLMTNNPIKEKIQSSCCSQLSPRRILHGYGSGRSGIMFIGESPSLYSEAEGVCPFSQKSWPVFQDILKLFKTDERESYVTNIVKCCIPRQKTGSIELCANYLFQEVKFMHPRIIVVLSTKVQYFLENNLDWLRLTKDTKVIYHKHPMFAIYKNKHHEYIEELRKKKEKQIPESIDSSLTSFSGSP